MHKTICIIDDDPILLFTLKHQIAKINQDIKLVCFKNGKEAFDYFNATVLEFPDVIFLDINMPVWDAWDFLNEWKKIKNTIATQIYILSSSINPKDVQISKKYQCVQSFLVKPISLDTLRIILND
ncbi:Probable two-component system response regulatory protein [Flavobacterium indicum GPTSA100-9 = DSM 17447]|uniref:Probable two-component system response regulatory protein n=1 Tax=Flavobacterium indicum (strain DSM 17447 / CIP 109464 / GPTSA100-9) TaxID=1094466 RepID=H8XTZ8_FLAIG|nr:response regulator [Flavobacterium indicum]CCG53728.1 Probable two-component system response regulatory protein [Flavobacterium indicum GPTSA100-9 = DSM 17447]